MTDDVRFVLLFGRLVDLLRSKPAAVEDQKAALRGLAGVVERRSLSLRLAGGSLRVEQSAIPADTPFGPLLIQQLGAHGLAVVTVSQGAPAVDLLHLARAIALDPRNYPIGTDAAQRLREVDAVSVSLVTVEGEQAALRRRALRVSDVIQQSPLFAVEGGMSAGAHPPLDASGTRLEDIAARPEPPESLTTTLAGSVAQLRDDHAGPKLAADLDQIQRKIEQEMRQNNVLGALEGILALVRGEEGARTPDVKRAYGIMVRRSLSVDTLRRLAPYLLDELYVQDVLQLMRRAGSEGTQVMIQLLVSAPTFAERKAYLSALRTIQEGTDVVASLLQDPEWYIVRNGADLVGELRLADAVPLLGRVAEHEDQRVRLSVALALAKIGTPEAVRFLRAPLRDLDRNVRLALAREIRGKGLSALSMVLLHTAESEQDPEVQAEYYRAMGRIGTPEAVQALIEVTRSAGKGLFARRQGVQRLAATEGLALAGGDVARTALEELASDRDKAVRAVARTALDRG
jgi:hypothetical protein